MAKPAVSSFPPNIGISLWAEPASPGSLTWNFTVYANAPTATVDPGDGSAPITLAQTTAPVPGVSPGMYDGSRTYAKAGVYEAYGMVSTGPYRTHKRIIAGNPVKAYDEEKFTKTPAQVREHARNIARRTLGVRSKVG